MEQELYRQIRARLTALRKATPERLVTLHIKAFGDYMEPSPNKGDNINRILLHEFGTTAMDTFNAMRAQAQQTKRGQARTAQ